MMANEKDDKLIEEIEHIIKVVADKHYDEEIHKVSALTARIVPAIVTHQQGSHGRAFGVLLMMASYTAHTLNRDIAVTRTYTDDELYDLIGKFTTHDVEQLVGVLGQALWIQIQRDEMP